MLFLSYLDPDLHDVSALIEEAETQILEGRDAPVHFTLEYLDPSILDADTLRQKKTLAFLKEKHQEQVFDLVITIGGKAGAFEELCRARLFPTAALLFFVVNPEKGPPAFKPSSNATGVVRRLNYLPALQVALRQNPGTRRVIVVSGSSDLEKLEVQVAREQFQSYESSIDFQYWTDLKFAELRSRLAAAGPDSVVLFLDFLEDAAGEQFTPDRVLRTVAKTASRPMYGTYLSFVGNGVVGGHVADLHEVGRILGREGVRVLSGENAQNIPVETGEFQRDVFDWRQLHRWGISEDELPPGSSVLFWEYSPWELYRWRIFGLLALIAIEALLIALLVRSRANRKSAEESLRQKEEELSEAQRLAELGSWTWNPRTDAVVGSDTLYELIGLDPGIPMPTFKQLSQFFTPQSRERLTQEVEKVLRTGESHELELEGRSADGSGKWVTVRGEAVRDARGQVCLVRGTMQNITVRKQMEESLLGSQERLMGIVASAMDAIIAIDDEQKIVVFNASAEKMFMCPAQDAIGSPIDRFIPQHFRTVHAEHIRHFGQAQVTNQGMGALGPLWGVRTNHEEFPIEASISQAATGQARLLTVIIRDITERLRAEDSVRESERRFRLMADSAPVLMWLSGPDKLCTDFNQEWLRFTGRTMQEELGEGWTESVHPDDLQACLRTYGQAFDARHRFAMEYRLRRHDGEYRWMFDQGVPRFLENGGLAGYIGCCFDITDQKEAKAVLTELSGRLIHAQEEERSRIARELHDDINQRLALLANGLLELAQTQEAPGKSEQKSLRDFWQQTNAISNDIQHLSHQLHPSKLHYLGLAAAARDLCSEFSRQHKIKVECIVRDLPRDLDETVSLSLFRTIQESLRNVAKHSQAHQVKVELTRQATVVQLRVSDDGIGFNPDSANQNQGLGLVSIGERLRSVGGELFIRSQPSLGTQVVGTVPATARRVRSA